MSTYRTILLLALTFLSGLNTFSVSAQNATIPLFDRSGTPVAYIDTKDDSTIYMWNGYPVAYLYTSGADCHVYGFNGKHLGWLKNGIIYNHEGRIAGFVKDAIDLFTRPEPYKPIKKSSPTKLYKDIVPYKPYFRYAFAQEPLSTFLQAGIDN